MSEKSVRVFDMYSVGFAIYLVLSSTSAWGLLWLASMPSVSFSGMSGAETARSIGYIGILLLFGLGCLYVPSLFKRDTTYHSTVCLVVGYAGLFLSVYINNASLQMFSAFLIGLGSSLSFIVWQRLFAAEDDNLAAKRIITGSALSAFFYLLIAFIAWFWLYIVAMFLCVALNGFFLKRCRGKELREPSTNIVIGQSGGATLTNIVSSTWRYMLCTAAIGYVSGISRMFAQQSGGSSLVLNAVLALGMLIAAVSLGIIWSRVRGRLSFSAVYTALFLTVMTGFLFLPFLESGYRIAFAGLANAAFSIVSIFMMVTCVKISKLRQVDPIGVFGVFASIVYGSVLIGRAIGDALGQTYDVSQILVIALMSTYILSFAGVVINLRRGGRNDQEFDPVDADAVHVAEDKDSNRGKEFADNTVEGVDLGTQTTSKPIAPLIRNVIVAQDMVPVCSRMMKRVYGLSNRETDVLELIIRGRDVARMAETLFVSENTVRSHCKNLYRKLGVHNRQQVFDLVEEFRERDDIDAN